MQQLTGWWYTYPSEKYERQWEGLSHPTPLKNMKVNGKDYPIYYGK
jgi:hypothetical protein